MKREEWKLKIEKLQKKTISKGQLRSRVLTRRDKLTEEERKGKSHRISGKILKLNQVKKANTVFLYASFQSEVQTDSLIQDLLQRGKQVALPKVQGKEMVFYVIKSMAELQWSKINIREPYGWVGTEAVPEKNDVMLLPGTVFDRFGNRIGYGGGFYDRYLISLEQRPVLIGVCYSLQLRRHKLPIEDYDRPVDYLVTEKEVVNAEKEIKNQTKGLDWISEVVEGVIELVADIVTDAF